MSSKEGSCHLGIKFKLCEVEIDGITNFKVKDMILRGYRKKTFN